VDQAKAIVPEIEFATGTGDNLTLGGLRLEEIHGGVIAICHMVEVFVWVAVVICAVLAVQEPA